MTIYRLGNIVAKAIRQSRNAALKSERMNNALSSQQGGKTREPYYEIEDVDFNERTRTTKVFFIQTQEYRTIERYITFNYQKTPVYSEWKTKEKRITKSFKADNTTLENLKEYNDEIIKQFAFEIIELINDDNLLPSWFVKECIIDECNAEIKTENEKINNFRSVIRNANISTSNKVNILKQRIKNHKLDIEINQTKMNKLIFKNEKLHIMKWTILIITTLSIYLFFHKKIINNRKTKIERLKSHTNYDQKQIQNLNDEMNNLIIQNGINEKEINHKINKSLKLIEDFKLQMERKIMKIAPLSRTISTERDFISLKKLNGVTYTPIKGCYVIRNVELNKFYVGQSKDVLKRLKQHFNGTEPKNIIFAKDYFESKLDDKSNLFLVKILELSTKDELDETEKMLIEQYDAFINGYNGTSGNT